MLNRLARGAEPVRLRFETISSGAVLVPLAGATNSGGARDGPRSPQACRGSGEIAHQAPEEADEVPKRTKGTTVVMDTATAGSSHEGYTPARPCRCGLNGREQDHGLAT